MSTQLDRTWIEISRSAFRHNLRTIRALVNPVPVAPVIKANAYGHGLAIVSDLLRGEKIWGVAVAYGQEAIALRRLGWPGRILVMSYWSKSELLELIKHRIEIVVWDSNSLKLVGWAKLKTGKKIRVHVKLDTGTSRLGFKDNDLNQVSRSLKRWNLQPAGVFSHLANSEEASSSETLNQVLRFTTLAELLPSPKGITKHLSCTAAALRYPGARFGLVRPGIGLYGLWPSNATKSKIMATKRLLNFQPVMTWKSRLIQVRRQPAGTSIGYGSTVRLNHPRLIGTVPVGYSDGYRRIWSNRAWTIINGRRAPVIGRISMNLLMVDLQRVLNPAVGDEVRLLGPDISAETLAKLASTLNYEVVAGINPMITRRITR